MTTYFLQLFQMHILFETSSGYSLFETHSVEDVGRNLPEVQKEILDISKFGKRVTLTSFLPFKSAAHALENINSLADGNVPESLGSFLELSLPKASKKASSSKSGVVLGVSDKALAGTIKQGLGINCVSDDLVHELIRGIRYHSDKLLSQYLLSEDLRRSQLGLGHAFSRGKVAFNVNRSDNMIIQAIALCDQLDKDINLFSMRIKEWYSWHFPELSKIVSDNSQYAKLALLIRQRSNIQTDPQMFDKLVAVVNDTNVVNMIVDASKLSMGMDIVEADMANIDHFAKKLVDLVEYRASLGNYLHNKMTVVAPNLAALIGDSVGARLISHAGSLTNLAKFPASTVQILGAEKALFRALKTRGKTPKYGLIFHSTFIGKAGSRNKGRISRFLANKCSIASRLDSFSEAPDSAFGDALRQQVEQRLEFFDGGPIPPSNQEVIHRVMEKAKPVVVIAHAATDVGSSSKKRKQSSPEDSQKEDAPKVKKETKAAPISEDGIKTKKDTNLDDSSSKKEDKSIVTDKKKSAAKEKPSKTQETTTKEKKRDNKLESKKPSKIDLGSTSRNTEEHSDQTSRKKKPKMASDVGRSGSKQEKTIESVAPKSKKDNTITINEDAKIKIRKEKKGK